MNFKNLILSFLFISPFAYGTGKSSGKLLLAQSVPTSQQTQAQTAVPKDTPVEGIIIKFHHWPGEEEETAIKNHLKKFGLKSVEELKQLNMWIVAWPKPDQIIKAEMACHSLSNFSSIKVCGPAHPTTIDDSETGDLRSCDIVSASFGLQSGKLSDYWAQRMIGSDLIKEELEQADPIGKKELVRVFDTRTRKHHEKVSNLISDDGDHSVLPDVGNKMKVSITPYTSSILREANRMLENAENVCSSESEEDEDTDENTGENTDGNTGGDTDDGNKGDDTNKDTKDGDTSDGGTTAQGSEPETFTHNETEYIRLHGWANNRNYEVANVIGFLNRKNIGIEYIDNPYVDQLKAAGESYSPTVHTIPNTESNRTKLEEFAQARGETVYNRNLTVVWKTATNWSEAWKSASGDQTPDDHYDLEADYEMDMDQNSSIRARREYRYIFRRPVLDMRGATSISTNLFNWLPFIVLAPGNKLKIWGAREVGNGPLTINGVSVTLTEVAGTISDVPSSGMRHGRFEATLNAADYNTILTGGGISNSNSDSTSSQGTPPRTPSSQDSSSTSTQTAPPQQQPPQERQQPLQDLTETLLQEQPQNNPLKGLTETLLQEQPQPSTSTQGVSPQTSSSGSNSGQRSSSRKPSASSVSTQQPPQPVAIPPLPETVTYNGISYTVLRAWVNSRGFNLADVISFLRKEGVSILQVNNPQAAALMAAGKSWSPTVHAIINSESNRAKLERFAQGQSGQ